MLADELDYVVGVDTHRDEHVLAVLAAPRPVVTRHAIATNARGYGEALRFAEQSWSSSHLCSPLIDRID